MAVAGDQPAPGAVAQLGVARDVILDFGFNGPQEQLARTPAQQLLQARWLLAGQRHNLRLTAAGLLLHHLHGVSFLPLTPGMAV